MTTIPSAVNFKMRMPAFSTTDDTEIEFALEEAARFVDDSWIAGDQILALMYMAAHLLSIESVAADSDGRVVTSEHLGPMGETYASSGGSSAASTEWLMKTSYGERFLEYRRRSRPAVMVV